MATDDKCGSNDRLCEDNDDTCLIVRETLEMSVKLIYMMRTTHFDKYFLLKKTKTPLYMIRNTYHAKRQHLLYKEKSVNDNCEM